MEVSSEHWKKVIPLQRLVWTCFWSGHASHLAGHFWTPGKRRLLWSDLHAEDFLVASKDAVVSFPSRFSATVAGRGRPTAVEIHTWRALEEKKGWRKERTGPKNQDQRPAGHFI